MLTNTPKILNLNKGDILRIISPQSDEKYGKNNLMQISEVFGTH